MSLREGFETLTILKKILSSLIADFIKSSFLMTLNQERTFSKVFGLAGLRIGSLITNKELAKIIDRKFQMPYSVSLIALKTHQTQVAMVFGTDASVAKYGWHVYADDKSFFPPYDLTPCVRREILSTHPEIGDILNALVATFPGWDKEATPHMIAECRKIWQDLNARVDIDKMEPREVAHEYLRRHSLMKNGKPQSSKGIR